MKETQSAGPVAFLREALMPCGRELLHGDLALPVGATSIVLFAHGSGSGRHSPRNQRVARTIAAAGMGTLLFDLLTPAEERDDDRIRILRFDIGLLSERLVDATDWIARNPDTRHLNVGYFGASTGAAAALVAAAGLGRRVRAVVSRGGRPDLAGASLEQVRCPTLLIVGGLDETVIRLNEEAGARLSCEKAIRIVPGATHLFEEQGALETVADMAVEWFGRHLAPRT
jgi:dienelactone hydrolase